MIASIQLIISAFARNDPNFMSGNLVHALYAFLSLYFGDHHISIVEDQTNANLIEGQTLFSHRLLDMVPSWRIR